MPGSDVRMLRFSTKRHFWQNRSVHLRKDSFHLQFFNSILITCNIQDEALDISLVGYWGNWIYFIVRSIFYANIRIEISFRNGQFLAMEIALCACLLGECRQSYAIWSDFDKIDSFFIAFLCRHRPFFRYTDGVRHKSNQKHSKVPSIKWKLTNNNTIYSIY